MKSETRIPPKLNLFALPNQTTILFILIVTALLAVVVTGTLGTQPFMVPLAVGMFLLPIRAFLALPEKEFAKLGLEVAGEEYQDLVDIVVQSSVKVKLPRVPTLVVSHRDCDLHAFGSFRHWYIALSHNEALQLQKDLGDKERTSAVEAIFIHELYHFKNGDYLQMMYVRELFRISAFFMLWAMLFMIGYVLFLVLTLPDALELDFVRLAGQLGLSPEQQELFVAMLPPPDEWAEIRAKAREIDMTLVLSFVTNATIPFILVGGILWLFYWPKLLRTRELYADAGVAHVQKRVDPLNQAWLLMARSHKTSRIPSSTTWLGRIRHWLDGHIAQIRQALKLPTFVTRWFSTEPTSTRRFAALQNPVLAFDPWWATALWLGSLALILDIMLATPLTLPYHGRWPMHFSVLIIAVLVTLVLIEHLVVKRLAWKTVFGVVGIVVMLRFAWLSFTIGSMIILLVFAPDVLSVILESAITSTARYTGYLEESVVEDLNAFVLEASLINIVQVIVIWVSLFLLIGINTCAIRRMFTWYGFLQNKRRFLTATYIVVITTAVFFGLTMLNLITTALLRTDELLKLSVIVSALLGMSVTVAGLAWFAYNDHKYAYRCPKCGKPVVGPYQLGRRCTACNEALHPWLVVEYES